MKVRAKNRFQATGDQPTQGTGKARGRQKIDRREPRPISLAELTGAVSSRRTYIRTTKLELADLQRAIADSRIPNMGVTINGNQITVDGVTLQFEITAEGIKFSHTAEYNQDARMNVMFDAAEKKLKGLANAARTLAFLDANSHLYGQPQITVLPDGRITIASVANVRVNPKLQSQAQSVLDQHKGGMVMPEVTQPAPRKAGKRTQLVG